jgi:hypothetical protein
VPLPDGILALNFLSHLIIWFKARGGNWSQDFQRIDLEAISDVANEASGPPSLRCD